MSQAEGGYFQPKLRERPSVVSLFIYIITYFLSLSSLNKLLFPSYYAKISVEGNLGRQAVNSSPEVPKHFERR